jgi:hypothetical protein
MDLQIERLLPWMKMDARKLRVDLEALWSAHNRGGDELDLEVIAVKA